MSYKDLNLDELRLKVKKWRFKEDFKLGKLIFEETKDKAIMSFSRTNIDVIDPKICDRSIYFLFIFLESCLTKEYKENPEVIKEKLINDFKTYMGIEKEDIEEVDYNFGGFLHASLKIKNYLPDWG